MTITSFGSPAASDNSELIWLQVVDHEIELTFSTGEPLSAHIGTLGCPVLPGGVRLSQGPKAFQAPGRYEVEHQSLAQRYAGLMGFSDWSTVNQVFSVTISAMSLVRTGSWCQPGRKMLVNQPNVRRIKMFKTASQKIKKHSNYERQCLKVAWKMLKSTKGMVGRYGWGWPRPWWPRDVTTK